MSKESIHSVLLDGGRIIQAPLQAGAIMLLTKEGKPSDTKITVEDFLLLQELNQIELSSSVRQGHSIFHGRVDTFKIRE